MTDLLRHGLAIAAKDLRVELRSRTALVTAIAFAALVLVIFNFARDPAGARTIDLAPSILWVTITFASMLTFNRAFALEKENAALDGILLSPMPRGALFLGKYLANLAFVAFSRALGDDSGHVFTFFIIALAAAEAAVGLAILVGLYRQQQTVNLDEARLMRG